MLEGISLRTCHTVAAVASVLLLLSVMDCFGGQSSSMTTPKVLADEDGRANWFDATMAEFNATIGKGVMMGLAGAGFPPIQKGKKKETLDNYAPCGLGLGMRCLVQPRPLISFRRLLCIFVGFVRYFTCSGKPGSASIPTQTCRQTLSRGKSTTEEERTPIAIS